MEDESRINVLSGHPIDGNKPMTADQRRRMELDAMVARVDPKVRRAIQRETITTIILAIIVFGLIAPMVFGGIDFGERANGIIAVLLVLGFGWWLWRGRRTASRKHRP